MDKERQEMKAQLAQLQAKMQQKFNLPVDLIQTFQDIRQFIETEEPKRQGG